jgi:hypothetical protein
MYNSEGFSFLRVISGVVVFNVLVHHDSYGLIFSLETDDPVSREVTN